MKKKVVFLTSFFVVALCLSILPFVRFTPATLSVPCANAGNCDKLPELQVDNNTPGTFEGRTVVPPKIDLAQKETPTKVLGDETATGEKHIYVNLETQTLTAYQGDTLFMQTLISSGKWNPTPPGEYTIWVKLRSTRMSGGEGADAYDLPNVPYVMFFANDKVPKIAGFSLHGAYWHDNFGHPMSHGCVNMRQVDAEKLYNWADPTTTGPITYTSATNTGTRVTIQ